MSKLESEFEDIAEREPSGGERALRFLKRHGMEIALGIGFSVACAVVIKEGKTIKMQGEMISARDRLIEEGAKMVSDLKGLCAEKDVYVLKLASDALRNGSSEGGKALVDYRDFKNGRL